MSRQSVTALIERVSTDEALRNQLQSAATPEAKAEVLTAAGFDLGPSDQEHVDSILADGDGLDQVVGGVGASTITQLIVDGITALIC